MPRRLWLFLIFILLLCSLLDWVLFSSLPRLGLSYGPVWQPVLVLTLFQAILLFVTGFLWELVSATGIKIVVASLLALVMLGIFAVAYDGLYIEPFRLTVSEIPIHSPAFLPNRALRILQISDLHVERLTKREQAGLVQAKRLHPDIIVLTGDYLNSSYTDDPLSLQQTRQFLSQLSAPIGIFAVNGNTDDPQLMSALFDGLANIRVLNDEVLPVVLPGGSLYIVGETYRVGPALDSHTLPNLLDSLPTGAYSLLLYHTSDLITNASSLGVNLYLSGHTHGGQVRLPFYGALFTSAYYGKKYEMGQYTLGPTTLYVSRGIGMGGGLLPRLRLLCPPELALFTLGK